LKAKCDPHHATACRLSRRSSRARSSLCRGSVGARRANHIRSVVPCSGPASVPHWAHDDEAQTRAGLIGADAGIKISRRDAGRLKLVDLVLHQRDERGNDDGQPVTMQGRELKTKGLAASGGEKGEDVATGERGVDDFALKRSESVIPEGGLEGELQVVHEKKT